MKFSTSHLVIALACSLVAGTAQADILIRNATLYDGTGKPAVKGANILVKGDRIAQVSTSAIQPAGATVIDGTGKFVIPGLWDTHVHIKGGQGGPVFAGNNRIPTNDRALAEHTLLGYIYSGVTSVYDSANNEPFIYPLRADERAGKIVSPRLFVAGGAISVKDGYAAGPTALKVTTWEETKKGLDDKLSRKPDMLKMIKTDKEPTLSDEQFKQITAYAREKGFRTTVHAGNNDTTMSAVLDGVTALAHPVPRGNLTPEFIKLLVDRKIPVSTTTIGTVTTALLEDEGGMAFLDDKLFKDTYTDAEMANAKGAERDEYIKFGLPKGAKAGIPETRRNIKQLFDAGVILTAGTDKGYGPYFPLELVSLNLAGIPAFDLIKMSTLNSAIYVGREKDLGSIETGKYADILVLNADPAADVKNFKSINAVIKNGQKIDLAKLDLPVNHRK